MRLPNDFDHQTDQQRKAELLRRAGLVQRAIILLTLLKKMVSQRSTKVMPARDPKAAVASAVSLKVGLTYLLDHDALEALLRELEQALVECAEDLGPERLAPALAIHSRAARFLNQPEALAVVESRS